MGHSGTIGRAAKMGWKKKLLRSWARKLSRSCAHDPILSTQRIPRGRDPIFPTQRIRRGRDPILSTQTLYIKNMFPLRGLQRQEIRIRTRFIY